MAKSSTSIKPGERRNLKHGADSFEARGIEALDAGQLANYQDIQEYTRTHEGVRELIRERASRAEMACRLLENWLQEEQARGVPLDEIKVLNRLGTYQENARRALAALLAITPEPVAVYQDVTDWLEQHGADDGS